MDGLLTLSSPRSIEAKASFTHKASARSRSSAPSPRALPSPHAGLSPRPPPARSSPRSSSNGAQPSTPRTGRTFLGIESFRSVTVLEEIVRVGSGHAQSTLRPDEAFQLLQRLLAQTPSSALQGLTHQQLLDGLEAACWRRFASSSPTRLRHHNQCNSPTPSSSSSKSNSASTPTPRKEQCPLRLAVPYTQLYSGITESIRDRQATIQCLEGKIRETVANTNELPRRIKAHERTIVSTIASFVYLSAVSLDCAVQRSRPAFGTNQLKTRVDPTLLAEKVRARIDTLRRRKDLRAWACEQLRGQINDHMTRASELRKEITVVLGEVKKEELSQKVVAKRMEEAMEELGVAPTGHKNSKNTASGVLATKVLVAGGLAAVATAANLPGTSFALSLALHQRLSLAQEQRQELQDALAQKRELVRRRTEEIFDVRNDVKQLEATRADLEAQTEALATEKLQIQRACTPRPDWEELQRAVNVTTTVNRLAKTARRKLHARERRGRRKDAEEDEEDSTARRMCTILSSKWSTVEKVEALAQQLIEIRERYHGGDELSTERAKLTQLQKEIQKTIEQLSTVRASASRGKETAASSSATSREGNDER